MLLFFCFFFSPCTRIIRLPPVQIRLVYFVSVPPPRDRQRQNGRRYDLFFFPLLRRSLLDDSVSSLNADIFGLISICPHYSGLKLARDPPDRLTQRKSGTNLNGRSIRQCLVRDSGWDFRTLPSILSRVKDEWSLADSDKPAGKLAGMELTRIENTYRPASYSKIHGVVMHRNLKKNGSHVVHLTRNHSWN